MTAAAMLCLVPSAPNAVGTVWLIVHFDRRARVEEAAVEERFGNDAWREYAGSGVQRWFSTRGLIVLAFVLLLCGCCQRKSCEKKLAMVAIEEEEDDEPGEGAHKAGEAGAALLEDGL